MSQKANRLANEASPYLRQHAFNPVDWYPWGEEALTAARQQNKPILLSIGYSACHWCHVMAHDTFEDKDTADVMNALFINIKVDREERPDLDMIYQFTHYLLTRQGGGWPLTVILTPDDLMPFFSGTYFPAKATEHLPAFANLLTQLSDIFHHRLADIQKQHAELAKFIYPPKAIAKDVHLNQQPIQHALASLQRHYDAVNGGFGNAPKFPQPSRLDFLLQQQSPLVATTLQHMARGGIADQLGGGFFRYTVDAQWRIPHFEKMLYDNAQLLALYLTAFQQHDDMTFANTAREIAQWILSHMQSPEGGYYTSMDADSEGDEGKYYVWDKTEIESLLNEEEFAFIAQYYGLNEPANFESHWHLYIADNNMDISQPLLHSAKAKLLAARDKRIAPAIDTKILTGWNALMIKSMFMAGYILNEPVFTDSAKRALQYIKQHAWHAQRLHTTNSLMAYLDDYVFLMDALLTAYSYSQEIDYLDFAKELAAVILKHFYDKEEGGFYFTADDHEKLLFRPKQFMDEAAPAGNAIAAKCLLKLSELCGDDNYKIAAEKTVQAGWPLLSHYPAEHAEMLMVLNKLL